MNLITAIILFNILILIYQIIIEIFTIACGINGISLDKAKFQVISLLTGTGFTTHESETMLLTKKRRKLTERIMLFSYIFNVCIVSIFVNIFISSANTTLGEVKVGVILTLANLVIIGFLNHSRTMKKLLDWLIVAVMEHKNKKKDNFISIYDTYGNKVIAEIEVKHLPKELRNKTIEQSKIKYTYNIQLLVIKRKEEVISEVLPTSMIREGDVIIVFGKLKDIKELFIRMMKREEKEEKQQQYTETTKMTKEFASSVTKTFQEEQEENEKQ